ncbi:MAG: M28 family peptidase [Verrucomicrobiales bacterium]|nr:M28 family peptidase [Verrucomicrobiales bacterium]
MTRSSQVFARQFPVILILSIFGLLLAGCGKPEREYDPESTLVDEVSGDFAFAQVRSLVGFGPRPTGSPAWEKSQDYLGDQLGELGWVVKRESFIVDTPAGEQEFVNVRARFGPNRWEEPIHGVLCAHYDTKRFEGFSHVGANDGASGVGVLLELARVLRLQPSIAEELELVFFDGEEAQGPRITSRDGLYGSRHYAKELLVLPERRRPGWGILVGMSGGRDLRIRAAIQIPSAGLEALAETKDRSGYVVDILAVQHSLQKMARDLATAGRDLEFGSTVGISPKSMVGGHIPLNVIAGVPAFQVLDSEYPYQHTPSDTMDKLSPESLEISAKIVLQLIEKYSPDW